MKARLWRLCIAITLSATALTLPASTLADSQPIGYAWDQHISVCITNDFTNNEQDVIEQGINKWADAPLANRPIWNVTHGTGQCGGYDVVVDLATSGPAGQGGCTAWNTNALIANRYFLYLDRCTHGEIWLSKGAGSNSGYWWGQGTQSCTVTTGGSGQHAGCDPDAKTLAAHEFGHILGLGHTWSGVSDADDFCHPGYSANSYIDACDGKADRMMANWTSFEFLDNSRPSQQLTTSWVDKWQGYRHTSLTSGDETKLADLYPVQQN